MAQSDTDRPLFCHCHLENKKPTKYLQVIFALSPSLVELERPQEEPLTFCTKLFLFITILSELRSGKDTVPCFSNFPLCFMNNLRCEVLRFHFAALPVFTYTDIK